MGYFCKQELSLPMPLLKFSLPVPIQKFSLHSTGAVAVNTKILSTGAVAKILSTGAGAVATVFSKT